MTKLLNLREAAQRVSARYFDVSHRTLEAWSDLPRRRVNRQIRLTEEEIDRAAERRIAEANARLAEAGKPDRR